MWGNLFKATPREQQCLVYPRADMTVVVCRMQLGPGVYMSCDPAVKLAPSPRPGDLGQAVLKALKATRAGGNTASLQLPFVPGAQERTLTVDSDGKEVRVEGRTVPARAMELGLVLLELAARPAAEAGPVEPEKPRGFGYKTIWAAARCSPDKLIAGLELRQVRPCSWSAGLASGVFVTPELDGWSFAVGLPGPDPEVAAFEDPMLLRIEKMSQRLGTVHYFASDRVVGMAAWAKAEDGTIVRAYAYLGETGETLWRLGAPTPEEADLGLPEDEETEGFADEEHVRRMAARWSVEPHRIGEKDYPPSTGWCGELAG